MFNVNNDLVYTYIAAAVDIVNPVLLTCDMSINYATFWFSVQQRLLYHK